MSEPQFDSNTLQNKLRQVQSLLDRSEHPSTPPKEAASSRKMAEKLMAKYRIEEEDARKNAMAQGLETMKPTVDEFPVCRMGSKFIADYKSMFWYIIDHVGNIRSAYRYVNGESVAIMIGFESDVKYAQTLYTSLRLHFANTLEPEVDSTLSDKENIYRLRSAGWVRRDIRIALGWPENTAGKVQRLYEEACRDRGEDPVVAGRSVNVKLYRKSFADAYVSTIGTRLYEMRRDAEGGTELQLRGRKEAVDEAYYERFPQFRPQNREDRMIGEGTMGGPGGNCPKCKGTKSGYCRDHNYLKPRAYRPDKQSMEGIRAGRAAGQSADLGGPSRGTRLEGGQS